MKLIYLLIIVFHSYQALCLDEIEQEKILVKDFFSFQDKLSRPIYSFQGNNNLTPYPESIKKLKANQVKTLEKGLNFVDLRYIETVDLEKYFHAESWNYLKNKKCGYSTWKQLNQDLECKKLMYHIFYVMGVDFTITSNEEKEQHTKSCPEQKNSNFTFIKKSVENDLKSQVQEINNNLVKIQNGVEIDTKSAACALETCINDKATEISTKELKDIQKALTKSNPLEPLLASKFFSCDGRYIEDSSPAGYLNANNDSNGDIVNYKKDFDELKNKYAKLGINPLKIKDLIARRFVNRSDWEKYLDKKLKAKEPINPYEVYNPAPVTWQNWRKVTDKYIDRKVKSKSKMTLDELVEWNGEALAGTLPTYIKGSLKNTNNYGTNVSKATALNELEIENIQKIKIPGPKNESVIKWVYTQCLEDLQFPLKLPNENEQCQAYYKWVKAIEDKDEFAKMVVKKMEKGELVDTPYWFACWPRSDQEGGFSEGQLKKHCGFIEYPLPEHSKESFEKIITMINASTDEKNSTKDPIKDALTHQLQVVGLHPFNKGNGRTSRWIMDYITLSNGLPPILIHDMNIDLSTPEKTYYTKSKRGIYHSLQIMKRCLVLHEKAKASAKLKQEIQNSECGIDEISEK